MLGVLVLDSRAVAFHENFNRGMRVAGGALPRVFDGIKFRANDRDHPDNPPPARHPRGRSDCGPPAQLGSVGPPGCRRHRARADPRPAAHRARARTRPARSPAAADLFRRRCHYDFSEAAIEARWQAGYADARRMIALRPWDDPVDPMLWPKWVVL